MVEKNRYRHYIPEKDELEVESNYRVDVKDDNKLKTGRVEFPSVENDYTDSSFKADIAQQTGRFSDQVLMDSPAMEAGKLGQYAIKDIIDASEKKLKDKLEKRDKIE